MGGFFNSGSKPKSVPAQWPFFGYAAKDCGPFREVEKFSASLAFRALESRL